MAKEGSDREKFNIAMNSVLEKYGGIKEFDKALRLAGIVGGDADRATPPPPPPAPPLRVPWNFPTNLRAEAESFENIPQRTFPESERPEMTDAQGAAFAAALGERLGATERVPTQRAATEVEPVPQEFQGAPGPQVDADVMDFEFGGGEFRPAEEAVPEIVAPRTSPPRRGNIPNPRFTEAVGEQYRQYGEEMARRGPPPSSVGVPRFTEAELFPASDPVEQDGQSGTGAEVLSDLLIPADFAGSEAIPDEVYGAGLGVLSGPPPPAAVADPVDSRIFPTQRKFRVGPQTEMLIGSLRLNERAEGMPADQLLSEIEQSGRLPEGFDGKGVDPQILRRANLQALLAVQEARAPGLEIDVAQRKAALSRKLVEPGTLRPEERVRLAEKKRLPRPSIKEIKNFTPTWRSGDGADGASIQSRMRNILSGLTTGDAKKVDATTVAEQARTAGDAMRASLEKKTRTLISQQDASIDKIAKADKASLKKISESMTALKDFQETGRLPKKHRDALINAGLMEFGAALLDPNNPTLYGAFSAGLRGFQKIEKGKRKEYLEGLKYALTAETAQQELAMKIRNSEAVARRSLAQFQIAQQSRDEAAAAAAEKRYTDATNDARRYALQERTADIAQLGALANMLNATKPGVRIQEFNMLMDNTLKEAQTLAEGGDFTLMDKAFVTSGGKITPKMEYFIEKFTSMSGSAFRDYLALSAHESRKRGETRTIRAAATRNANAMIKDFRHPLWKEVIGHEPTETEWREGQTELYNKAIQHFMKEDQGQGRDELGIGLLPPKPKGN
jgi:hypothetical protein